MTRKSASATAFIAMSILIFTACKKSDDSDNSLVGAWEVASLHSSSTINTTPPSTNTFDTSYSHGKSPVITFKADNTYISVDNTTATPTTTTGTYLIAGSNLVVKDNAASTSDTATYSITGNALSISQTITQKSGNYINTTIAIDVFNRL